MPKFDSSSPSSITELVKSISVHVSGVSQFERFQRLYKDDRVAFVHDAFPEMKHTLAPYQVEILGYYDEGETRVAVRSPHGAGKTMLASVLVHHAILTAETDCKVPTTASAWRQLEKYLWPEIHKTAKLLAWALVGREPYDRRTELLTLALRLHNTVEAFALASDDHELIEGAHATRLVYVFDEAKAIPSATWNAAEGAFAAEGLADSVCLAFAISTPGDPSGRFYDIHMREPGYDDWRVRHITLDEAIRANRVSHDWAKRREIQWGKDSSIYQNRVLGEFADSGEDGAIPRSWVLAAIERWKDWDRNGRKSNGGPRRLGVDTARYGEDSTVIAQREASVIQNLYTYRRLPTTSTAGIVKSLASGRYVNVEMDGGLGAAVYDILKEQAVPMLVPVTVGGRTHKRDRSGELGFLNVRSAMWWNLREMLDPVNGDGVALPPHDLLLKDLITPKWTIKSNGVISIEGKDTIKTRLGRSTDHGDAVCLAFWDEGTGGGIVF